MWSRIEQKLGEQGTLALLLLPGLLVLIAAQFYPLAWSAWISFVDWSLASSPTPRGFAGLANYLRALGDPVMREAAVTTITFALGTAALQMTAGFVLAWLTVGESRSMRVARTLLILPMVIAPVAVGTIWRMMLSARVGVINRMLALLGLPGQDWLGNPTLALASLIFIDAWEWIPFVTVIYAAALAALPQAPLAAAEVDGATPWQRFRFVVWPMLLPITVLIGMFRLIDALLTLDVVFTTTFGGPGFSTYTVTFWIYQQALRYFNIGYAAASSWLLLIACMVVAAAMLAWRARVSRWVGA